jgi:hypothetical protein
MPKAINRYHQALEKRMYFNIQLTLAKFFTKYIDAVSSLLKKKWKDHESTPKYEIILEYLGYTHDTEQQNLGEISTLISRFLKYLNINTDSNQDIQKEIKEVQNADVDILEMVPLYLPS